MPYADPPPLVVTVDVAGVWAGPEAPRDVDAAAVSDAPDVRAWLASMDAHDRGSAHGRYGLHGRLVTQAVRGERALLASTGEPEPPGWTRVVLPGQPSSLDPRGYPGWVRTAHLAPRDRPGPGESARMPHASPVADVALARARARVGTGYLWGGTTAYGLDCSGLVLRVFADLVPGLPRDAHDQAAAVVPVELGREEPGDLYFFAEPGGQIDHVGIVAAQGIMIDAGESRGRVAEEALSAARVSSMVAVARPALGLAHSAEPSHSLD